MKTHRKTPTAEPNEPRLARHHTLSSIIVALTASSLFFLAAAPAPLLARFLLPSLCLLCCLGTGRSQVSSDGLVGYYNFDDEVSQVTDSSAALGGTDTANDGAWSGATFDYFAGPFGSAARVADGAGGNYITVSGDDFDFGTGSFTVIYWFNTEQIIASDPAIVAGGGKNWSSSGATPGWVSFVKLGSEDNLAANVGDGTNRGDPDSIDIDPDDFYGDGEDHWAFVALVIDRQSEKLISYVADDLVTATSTIRIPGQSGQDFGDDDSEPEEVDITGIGDLTNGNTTVVIGQDGDLEGYQIPTVGIDDLSLWNRALSRDELWEIYANGRKNSSPLSAVVIPGHVPQMAEFSPETGQPLFPFGNLNIFKQFVLGFDESFSAGKTVSIPVLGDFGGKVGAEFNAKFGLEFGMCLGGNADFDLKFSPTVMLPDQYPSDIPIPITVAENLHPDSHFTTTFPPLGKLYADLIMDLQAGVEAEACVFGCFRPLDAVFATVGSINPALPEYLINTRVFPLARDPLAPFAGTPLLQQSTRCDPALSATRYHALELASFNRNDDNVARVVNVKAKSIHEFLREPTMELSLPSGVSKNFTADSTNNQFSVSGSNPFKVGDQVRVSNSGGSLPSGLNRSKVYYMKSTNPFALPNQPAGSPFLLSLTPSGGGTVNITDNGSGTHTLKSVEKPDSMAQEGGNGGFGSVSVNVPTVNTNSADSPESNTAQVLKSSGVEDVVAVGFDVAKFASSLLPPPLPPLSGGASVGPISLDYTLASLDLGPVIQLQMDFELTWNLVIEDIVFTTPEGDPAFVKLRSPLGSSFPLNDEILVSSLSSHPSSPPQTAPAENRFHLTNCGPNALPMIILPTVGTAPNFPMPQPPVEVSITYKLCPQLRTIVSTPLVGQIEYDILSAGASIDRVGGIGFGPIVEGDHKFKLGEFTVYDGDPFPIESSGTGEINFQMRAVGPPDFNWDAAPGPPVARWTANNGGVTNWNETISNIMNSYPGDIGTSSRARIVESDVIPSLQVPINPIQSLMVGSPSSPGLRIENSASLAPTDPAAKLTVNGLVENNFLITMNSFHQPAVFELNSETAVLCGNGLIHLNRGSILQGHTGPGPFSVCNYNYINGSGKAFDLGADRAGTTIHNLGWLISRPSLEGGSLDTTHVVLHIGFDAVPQDTSWVLKDSNDAVIDSGGPYGAAEQGKNIGFDSIGPGAGGLPVGNYTFTMSDASGDGLASGGFGSYKLVDYTGKVLASGEGNFGASNSDTFYIGTGGRLITSAENVINEHEIRARSFSQNYLTADNLVNLLDGRLESNGAEANLTILTRTVEHAGVLTARNGGFVSIGSYAGGRTTWDAGRSYRRLAEAPPLGEDPPEENCGELVASGLGSKIMFYNTNLNGGCLLAEQEGGIVSFGSLMTGTVIEIGNVDAFRFAGTPAGSLHLFGQSIFDGVCFTNYGTVTISDLTRFENSALWANHGTVIIEEDAGLWLRSNTITTPGASQQSITQPGCANITRNALVGGTWDIAGSFTIEGATIKTIGGNSASAFISSASYDADGGELREIIEENELNPNLSHLLSDGSPAKVTLRGTALGISSLNAVETNLGEFTLADGANFNPAGAAEANPELGIEIGDFCNKNQLVIGPASQMSVIGTYRQRGRDAVTTLEGDAELFSTEGTISIEGGTFTATAAAATETFKIDGGVFGGLAFPNGAKSLRVATQLVRINPDQPDAEPIYRTESIDITLGHNITSIGPNGIIDIQGRRVSFDELTDHIVSNAGSLNFVSRYDEDVYLFRPGTAFTNTGHLRFGGYYSQFTVDSYTQNDPAATTRISPGGTIIAPNGFHFDQGKLIIEVGGRPGQGLGGTVNNRGDAALRGPLSSFGAELVLDFVNMLGGDDAKVDVGDTWIIMAENQTVDVSLFGPVGCLFDGGPCPVNFLPANTELEFVSLDGASGGLAIRVVPDTGFYRYGDWATDNSVDSNSLLGAPSSDADDNGLSNAIDFAFGVDGSPLIAPRTMLDIVTSGDDMFMELSYVRPSGVDASFMPELSSDLEYWERTPMALVSRVLSSPVPGLELITLRSAYPIQEERQMFTRIEPLLNPYEFELGELPNNPITLPLGPSLKVSLDGYDPPGSATSLEIGQVLYFLHFGWSSEGYLVGGTTSPGGTTRSFIYSDTSSLGNAAVHAGLIGNQTSGIIKVTIVPTPSDFYGSVQDAGVDVWGEELEIESLTQSPALAAPYAYKVELHSRF